MLDFTTVLSILFFFGKQQDAFFPVAVSGCGKLIKNALNSCLFLKYKSI